MKPLHRSVLLATALATALAAALFAGCDKDWSIPAASGPQEQSGAADLARAKEKLAASQREAEQLRDAFSKANAENASLGRKVYGLETDLAAIRLQAEADRAAATAKIEKLTRDLAAAKALPATAAPPPMAATAPAAAGVPSASDSAATIETTVADLQARLAPLRAQVGQARGKVAALVRGTVDATNVAPPGGKIQGGQIYRFENRYDVYGNPIFTPIGSVIKKGDFRSQQEKENAIRAARAEATPLEMELKTLEDQLAQAKAALAKARGTGGN